MTRARNINPSLRHLSRGRLASNSMNDYWCCEVGNHLLTNQDEHSLCPLQIQDQNDQESAKPHHPQDET
jgi:hypothetical protein